MAAAVDVYVIDLDGEADVARYAVMLSANERARSEQFRFDRDRTRYIVWHGRVREILSDYAGRPPAALAFGVNAFGKPALEDSTIEFNISHSQGLALCAVAADRAVGCDIERRNPQFMREQIPEQFFAPDEVRALRSLASAQQTEAFFNCWTRKEAYIKARGFGVSLPLDSFSVSLRPGEAAALLRNCDGWSVESFEPAAGFQAAVVAQGAYWRMNLRTLARRSAA